MKFAQLRCLCLAIARGCHGERVDIDKVEVNITYNDYRALKYENDERFVNLISSPLPKNEFRIIGVRVRIDFYGE